MSLPFFKAGALAGLLVSCAQPQPASPRAAPNAPDVVDLPLERTATGNIVLDVVANQKPLRFLLDTGASGTVITPRTGELLGFAADAGERADAQGGGGAVQDARNVRLASLAIAGWDVGALPVTIMKVDAGPNDRSSGFDGVLGKDVLSQRIVELDFSSKHLRFHPLSAADRGHDPRWNAMTRLPFETDKHGLIHVEAKLDGHDAIPAVLDLGAPNSIVNPQAGANATRVSHGKAVGADGAHTAAEVCTFASFELAGKVTNTPTLVVADLPIWRALQLADAPGMLIGLDLLASRTLVIDYDTHALYLSR